MPLAEITMSSLLITLPSAVTQFPSLSIVAPDAFAAANNFALRCASIAAETKSAPERIEKSPILLSSLFLSTATRSP